MKSERKDPYVELTCAAPGGRDARARSARIQIWWEPEAEAKSGSPAHRNRAKADVDYDCGYNRATEALPELGEGARCNYQCFALLLAVALRNDEHPLTVNEVGALHEFTHLDRKSVEPRLRSILRGGALIERDKKGLLRLAKNVRCAVKPESDIEEIRIWLGPPVSGVAATAPRLGGEQGQAFLWQAVELFKKDDKRARMQADVIIETNASKFDYDWLLGLKSVNYDRYERAVMAKAIGHHPSRDARGLAALFDVLPKVELEGTVFCYRVLFSVRRLLVEGHRSDNMNPCLPILLRLRTVGGLASVAEHICSFFDAGGATALEHRSGRVTVDVAGLRAEAEQIARDLLDLSRRVKRLSEQLVDLDA